VSSRVATYGFAAVVLGIVVILVVPLPPPLLDTLLAIDIIGSGLVLLIAMTITDPLEFSAFAPALLIATLFRLSLDVSATRLILTSGHIDGGVGAIIPAFGEFVVRGNLVVGFIVFAILITIQFIVIATGSQRVAEVAARFTLDAMPGKQMAIDAEVHAGVLDAESARRKRAAVQREADFYGAMDGAGKFVKGDAIAALIIVALNIVGGIVVGMAYHGMSPLDALQTFAMLSIGNALVTTLPAFLLTTSMGLMVTRIAADGSLGFDLASQVLQRPGVLRTAGMFSLALALVPALPHLPFGLLGAALAGLSFWSAGRLEREAVRSRHERDRARRAAIRRPEMALGMLGVDAVTIEIGSGLAPLLTEPNADALLDRIGEVRRSLATEIGVVLPGVRLRDDLQRDSATYAIRVRDLPCGEGSLRLDAFLAVADEAIVRGLGTAVVREPVYGLPAVWIPIEERHRAEAAGALVFDAVSIIGSHLAEAARSHAAELVGRQELQTLIEHLRSAVPTLVKEIGPDALPIATVQRVYEGLLRERIWPRDPLATLEAIVDAAAQSRDPRDLLEAARRVLVPRQFERSAPKGLDALVIARDCESELQAWLVDGTLTPEPRLAVHVRDALAAFSAEWKRSPVVCSSALRPYIAEFARRFGLGLDVFSYAEIPRSVEVRPARVLALPSGEAAA
jgi:flagellar biosynthesis protein FlhA